MTRRKLYRDPMNTIVTVRVPAELVARARRMRIEISKVCRGALEVEVMRREIRLGVRRVGKGDSP